MEITVASKYKVKVESTCRHMGRHAIATHSHTVAQFESLRVQIPASAIRVNVNPGPKRENKGHHK